MPPTRTTTIATSTAQNDSGVFEFSFRDERYMPFEGAGAISDWNLKLPKNFRTFDYNTINDVIVHISYEADYDGAFAEKVEDANGTLEKSIAEILKTQGLPRLFSLRQEFSSAFHQLLFKPDEGAKIMITEKHFPIFVQQYLDKLAIEGAKLIFDFGKKDFSDVKININDSPNSITLSQPESYIEFSSVVINDDISLKLEIPNSIDDNKATIEDLKDVYLLFNYKLVRS